MTGILDVFDKISVFEDFASELEKTEILDFNVDMNKNSVTVSLGADFLIDKKKLSEYINQVKYTYSLSELEINIKYKNIEFSDEYYKGLLETLFSKSAACRAFLGKSTAVFSDNVLKISGVRCGRAILEDKHCLEMIKKIIGSELGMNVSVELCTEEFDEKSYTEEKQKRLAELEKSAAAAAPKKEKKEEKKEEYAPMTGLVYGLAIKEPVIKVSELKTGMEISAVNCEILDIEAREIIKGGKPTFISVNMDIADDSWGVSANLFGKYEKIKPVLPSLKKGNRYKIRGSMEFDNYSHKDVLKILSVETAPMPAVRQDNAEVKRVELHLHTKMSAKDAITSATDLINRAAKWGHPAIAITDHGVAQAFPEANTAQGKINKEEEKIKVLYGTEGYFVNDLPIGMNDFPRSYKDEYYVVFDIETTGLKASAEMITEIGAIKYIQGRVVDTFSQLVNPEKHIPGEITELTGITDEMVAGKPKIDEVLPRFVEFCRGCKLVAHNAKFDTGFIDFQAQRLGIDFKYETVDTLLLSRELFPEEKVHKLDVVAKRLGVSLENHHRAVDDAQACCDILVKLMEIKEEREKPVSDEYTVDQNPDLLKTPYNHIIILAKNYAGLKNMYRLISKSNLNYFYKRPRIPKSILAKFREGLIIGSACEQGEVYRAVLNNLPQDELEKIASFYDYLEIQPIGNDFFMIRNGTVKDEEDLREINRKIVALGDKIGKPVVATCDVHFMDPEDELYRRVLQGAQGYDDADMQPPLYFRTTEEMLEEFSYLGEEKAYEVVVKNTNLIADMIEKIIPVKSGSYPPSIENCEEDLSKMCHDFAHKVYGEKLPDVVQKRMDKELDSILGHGFAVMYMIAHKLVKKSNEAGYLVGSRGSVGSSFAAYLSGITEVNALCPHYICPNCKHSEFFENGEYNIGIDMPDKVCPECGTKMRKDGFNIPFETFLGFNGDKVPDIDLNFSGEYQATAHKYVEELFGEGYVFKAGTIGTIADKTATNFYARKYYEKKGIVPTQAELKRVSKGLVDVKNTTGQHPGGVIVCPKTWDIHDFCPVQHPAEKKDSDIVTTHFDFHSIHDNLLKLDILGHDDPSTIRMLEDLTGLDAKTIPLDDPETMSIFSGTEAIGLKPEQINSRVGTFGVPEFGTSFVRGMLLDTMPKTFFELLIISGLSHGTDVWLNNAQDLIREGTATLSEVIGLRDDIMVYLIQKGLVPGMAFKIMEFVRKGRAAKEGMLPEYEEAMRANNVPEWYINSCKKIKYMFPKAHAAAYVMMAFRIAYFKVHYPVEFYIAYFTVRADLFDAALMAKGDEKLKEEMFRLDQQSELSATEKSVYTIMELVHEMYQRGIEFLPVDIYKSHAFKFQKEDNKIRLPINAFQGLGDAAAQNIMNARKEGEFKSIDDLKCRAKLTKTVIETLKENGCLEGMTETSQLTLF